MRRVIWTNAQLMAMAVKEFVLDGRHMTSVDSFYDEVQRVLCTEFIGFGRNLDAFNDALRGDLAHSRMERRYDSGLFT